MAEYDYTTPLFDLWDGAEVLDSGTHEDKVIPLESGEETSESIQRMWLCQQGELHQILDQHCSRQVSTYHWTPTRMQIRLSSQHSHRHEGQV